MIATCTLCPDREKAFRVPWDEIGCALMLEHVHEHEKAQAEARRTEEVIDEMWDREEES